jgi:lipid II:glycine glycyltransferase (peptidoglycan interpeptide bridge formation enzyme)
MNEKPTVSDPYDICFNRQSAESWDEALTRFNDGIVYQSWAYAAARWGTKGLSTVSLFRNGIPASAALVRLIRLPFALGGIAYIGWGPVWQTDATSNDIENLRRAIRALRQEYAVRRRLFLRVVPNIYVTTEHPARQVFLDEGFVYHRRHEETIFLDLSPSSDNLRAQLRKSWRQGLVKAEKAGLEVARGTAVELFDEALVIYRQMHSRKKFAEFVDKDQFRAMQIALPERLKMQIILVRDAGEPVAALAWSAIGDTGLPLLAATGDRALRNGAANLMWWQMIQWLKQNGTRFCDLGGIDPVQNPGGFTFKTGIAGEAGRRVFSLGEFVCCTNPISRLAATGGIAVRNQLRRLSVAWRRHPRLAQK